MDIIRCNYCEQIYINNPNITYCPKCKRNDCIMDLDGTEEYYSKEQIKELWLIFGDIPMNPDTETIEDNFLCFPIGTDKETIWHWFDERYNGGVYELLYNTKE